MPFKSVIFSTAYSALKEKLDKRIAENNLRTLRITQPNSIDFTSNDYLGFSKSGKLNELISKIELSTIDTLQNGSTGSRLLTGNTKFAEETEQFIANYHNAEAGLIYNSGYDANVGLFACIANRTDTILYDEISHASIIDGIRLSHATTYKFRHNDLNHLKELLEKATGVIYVAVESIYSMDGDAAPLLQLTELCELYNANLIVDEAHATGIFGLKGDGFVSELKLENKVFARIHTFGKALGVHGAIILGNKLLREYLINFSRSFIYTTALPKHSIAAIKASYLFLQESKDLMDSIRGLIKLFKEQIKSVSTIESIESNSSIQALIVGNTIKTKAMAGYVQGNGFDVRAILSPTVPKGKERLRICIHAFNTEKQIIDLVKAIADF